MKMLVIISPLYSQLIAEKFMSLGYSVDVADDGKEGIEKIREVDYDVIIFGYVLKYFTGLEIMNFINEFYSGRDRPKTIMTSHVYSNQLLENLRFMKIDKFYPTPVDLDIVIEQNNL